MTRLHFIGGEKGGVGKSVVARILAQYFIDRQRPFIGFDTDKSHGSLLRFYTDYAAPVVATSTPPGTSVHVVYRGSASASGATPTEWSPSPNIADGYRHLQFRIVFRASLLTGERPLVDTLVVPFQ